MKTFLFFLFSFFSIIFLQGCNDTVSNPPENASVEQNNSSLIPSNDTQNDALFAFTSFDLDVDYEKNQSFEVEYDNEVNGMEAEIEDRVIHQDTWKGNEAFDKLKPIFQSFTFDSSTPDDQVISEVLRTFDLKTNYTEFDLEIHFNDGVKKEYKHY